MHRLRVAAQLVEHPCDKAIEIPVIDAVMRTSINMEACANQPVITSIDSAGIPGDHRPDIGFRGESAQGRLGTAGKGF